MKIICPASTCRTDNDPLAEVCGACGTPLRGFAQLSVYPAHLFNQGLSAAREGQMTQARDMLSALVYWCPMDVEARNALAMACLALGDRLSARHHLETVLDRSPTDTVATQGIAMLDAKTESPEKEGSVIPDEVVDQLRDIQENLEKHGIQLSKLVDQTRIKEEPVHQENNGGIQEVVETRLMEIEKRWARKVLVGGIALCLTIAISVFSVKEMIKLSKQVERGQGTLLVAQQENSKQLGEYNKHLSELTGRLNVFNKQNSIGPSVREVLAKDYRINWLNISVQQEDGNNVRLKGEVCTNYLRNIVERIVGDIEGINLVDSREIKIIPFYRVQHRDMFWKIAEKVYGDGTKWKIIYEVNRGKIPDPSMIREDVIIFIPNG